MEKKAMSEYDEQRAAISWQGVLAFGINTKSTLPPATKQSQQTTHSSFVVLP